MALLEPQRITQALPTIKCSICGRSVAIDQMGEHVCEASPPARRPDPYARQQRGYGERDDPPRGRSTPRQPQRRDPPPRSPLSRQSHTAERPPAAWQQRSPSRSAPRQDTFQTPPPPELEPVPEVDTKTGGAAGMAGVGRRGFAKKQLLTVDTGFGSSYEDSDPPRARDDLNYRYKDEVDTRYEYTDPGRGTEYGRGRSFDIPRPGARDDDRATAQRQVPRLDLRDNMAASSRGTTPMLSPSGYSSNSYSPTLPRSPESNSFRSPSPPSTRQPFYDKPRGKAPEVKNDRRRVDQKKGRVPDPPLSPDSDYTPIPSPEPFDNRRKNYEQPPSSISDSEDGYGGLAYAESDDGHPPAKAARGKPPLPVQTRPSLEKPRDPFASRKGEPQAQRRSPSARRGRESPTSVYSITTALDRTMEAIMNEEDDSVTSSPLGSTRELLSSPEQKERRLPTRSKTTNPSASPPMTTMSLRSTKTVHATAKEKDRAPEGKRARICAKCDKRLDDGRWVQAEGGKVLCEKCWKNMYLPKCRRCKLPIEKQAVSSSDGQLKGKYHKECFNCHKCHKPFPDKSFYVYDGRPLCAYHYHQANNSLCAAARCGQPIEGPCAVSHAGDRYHPEHLLCEHPDSRCGTRLEDYWEVDGLMLCARHAKAALRAADEAEEEDKWARRGQKRTTRFMNLSGGGSWR